jgi:CRP-like cAMP-binding protein
MASTISLSQSRNSLLAVLSSADSELLVPLLHPVQLRQRQRLELANRRIRAVYFPEQSLASVVAISGRERRHAEVGVIGREGMTGLALVFGIERAPHDVFVQIEGSAQCITASDLNDAIKASPTLFAAFLRYAHVYTVAIAHTALANARASVDERLARWLLMAQDRVEADEIRLTHDLLSLMLGIRRAGVTTALNAFETKGLISHALRSDYDNRPRWPAESRRWMLWHSGSRIRTDFQELAFG